MNRTAIAFLAVAVHLMGARLALADDREIDLSKTKSSNDPITVPEGQLTIAIKNALPSGHYRITWDVHRTPVPPLSSPPNLTISTPGAKNPCAPLEAVTDSLLHCRNEGAVEGWLDKMKVLRKQLGGDAACKDAISRADEVRLRTWLPPVEAYLGADTELRLVITRLGDDGHAIEKDWEVVYRTRPSGEWFLSYGFTFIPSEDELYYSKSVAPDKFQVTRKHYNQETDFAPAIFYAWMPEKFATSMFAPSLAAGLGFDLDNPVVFLGLSLSYHYNVSVLGGGVMHRVKRLNGMYSPGDTLSENLTESQLTEETYELGWFFGVSFRFGKSPKTHQGVVKALETDDTAATDDESKTETRDQNEDDSKPGTKKKDGEKPKGQ